MEYFSQSSLIEAENMQNEISNDPDEIVNCAPKQDSTPLKTKEDFENLYNLMVTEAPSLNGDCKLQILPKDIPWIQPKLLEEGRQFAKENYFSLLFAHIFGILVGFSVKSECVVMLRTGKFHKSSYASFQKIFSTGFTILSWYDGDILTEDSRVFKSIQFVRRMHLGAAKWRERNKNPVPSLDEMKIDEDIKRFIEAVKKDFKVLDTRDAPSHLFTWAPEVELSQLDNVYAQWGFYAVPYLFAHQCGITDLKFYDGYRHMWAVFGKLLGIEDRLNMALHCPPEMTHLFVTNFMVASLKEVDLLVAVAQRTLVEGLANLSGLVRIKPLIYYYFKGFIQEFKGDNLYSLMGWLDKVSLGVIHFIIWLTRYKLPKQILNLLTKVLVQNIIKNHLPKLARK